MEFTCFSIFCFVVRFGLIALLNRSATFCHLLTPVPINFSLMKKRAEIAAAEAEPEANKDQFTRVIVLRWQGTTTDQKDVNLQDVRSAIEKSDALFLPAIDLFKMDERLKTKPLLLNYSLPKSVMKILMRSCQCMTGNHCL